MFLPPLHGILYIGTSSLKAHQAALAVTGHNIANTNTEGYTRQRVGIEAEKPLATDPGDLGLGVRVTDIKRMRDMFLDGSVRLEVGQQGKFDQTSQSIIALETALGNLNSTNIGTGLTEFFNSFHALSTAPEDLGVRQNVTSKGASLADFFHDAVGNIGRLNTGLDATVDSVALDMNSMLDRIAELNKEISREELGNLNNANDFRDQRDLLLDKLSAYVDLTVVEQSNHMIDVSVNGELLVSGQDVFAVQVDTGGTHPEILSSGGGSLITSGGKLAGIADAYQKNDDTLDSLNDLASTLINEVNSRHGSGFDLNGVAGGDFFDGTDATTIAVNATLAGDPSRVVAAGAASPGNNEVALLLLQLQDTNVFPSSTANATLNEGYRNLAVGLGFDARLATDLADTHGSAATQIKEQRQSINGVNMDEELSNMIAYQRAYQAAARVITVVDEAMDTIINRMGRVGL